MFCTFRWRPPERSVVPGDFGICWYELALYYAIYTGQFLPIWIYTKDGKLPKLYAFDSPEANIQPDEKQSLWHQAGVLRSVVRYLENTLKCSLYPCCKKLTQARLYALDSIVAW